MDFEALERLGRLRQTGAITQEEFESEKSRLLSGPRHELNVAASRSRGADSHRSATHEEPEADRAGSSNVGKILLGVGFLAALLALSYAVTPPAATNDSAESAASSYKLKSRVKGIRIAPTTDLPSNPHRADQSCRSYEIEPTGNAGSLVRDKGWHVTSEVSVGKFDAVAFVGACRAISREAFRPVDGNIGMYEGSNLKAVIYGKRVGYIKPSDASNTLRISDTVTHKAFANVAVTSDEISVQK